MVATLPTKTQVASSPVEPQKIELLKKHVFRTSTWIKQGWLYSTDSENIFVLDFLLTNEKTGDNKVYSYQGYESSIEDFNSIVNADILKTKQLELFEKLTSAEAEILKAGGFKFASPGSVARKLIIGFGRKGNYTQGELKVGMN
jgi:hypothetical protein